MDQTVPEEDSAGRITVLQNTSAGCRGKNGRFAWMAFFQRYGDLEAMRPIRPLNRLPYRELKRGRSA